VPDVYAVWLPRDVIEAGGAESGSYLQGQLSQDVLALAAGTSTWSWVLAPTGKVDALVRVVRLDDTRWLMDTDRGWGSALLGRLNRFKLRTKVELSESELSVVGIRGGPAPAAVRAALAPVAEVPAWPGLEGDDLFVPPAGATDPGTLVPVVDPAAYEEARIRAGMPRMGAELTDRTIPGETGLIELTVSFTKGCYTGQELVARIDSRGGNVPRHLRSLAMDAEVPAGTELFTDAGQPAPAGLVTSAAPVAGGGWVGLGYVKRGLEPPLTLLAANGQEVRVEPITLSRR
jgi:tRNA-modifying protein YgfZ